VCVPRRTQIYNGLREKIVGVAGFGAVLDGMVNVDVTIEGLNFCEHLPVRNPLPVEQRSGGGREADRALFAAMFAGVETRSVFRLLLEHEDPEALEALEDSTKMPNSEFIAKVEALEKILA